MVTGSYYDGHALEMFLWTAAGGLVGKGVLQDPNSGLNGSVAGISADGSVVVGTHYGIGNLYAFRWTSASGFAALPAVPNGGYAGHGYAVSADGSTVV